MAEICANKILELEPENGAVYVLLTNIYAKCGRWEEVGRVKEMVMGRGVKKVPGCSLIEMNGEMHEFVAGDRTHESSDEIYAKMEEMGRALKLAGYAPDTAEVIFDICEEEKEDAVYRHSEKLAIAFGLLKSPAGAAIRVVKNLRMCSDCHNAVKLISAVYGRRLWCGIKRDSTTSAPLDARVMITGESFLFLFYS
ncbi:Pentatricopeptide repeat-containing protein [Platanthera zijinensis]|uniref:Pentatricopeptide repeat-containing protein n=1 Tax=Platanthera zijinensis TaxID=2320716 RepID=A0AAP0AT52_9ASPA